MAASPKIPPAQQAALAVAIVAAVAPVVLGVVFIDWPLLAIGGSGVGLAVVLAGLAVLRPAISATLVALLLIDGIALGWCGAALWNCLGDSARGTPASAIVVDRDTSHGRRGRRRHHITVNAGDGLQPATFRVSRQRHDELPPGSRVDVVLHPGALGARWLELAD